MQITKCLERRLDLFDTIERRKKHVVTYQPTTKFAMIYWLVANENIIKHIMDTYCKKSNHKNHLWLNTRREINDCKQSPQKNKLFFLKDSQKISPIIMKNKHIYFNKDQLFENVTLFLLLQFLYARILCFIKQEKLSSHVLMNKPT